MDTPLILTLKLDAHSFGVFDGLRRTNFPPELNFIPAHITLFHALPGAHESAITHVLGTACATLAPFGVRFGQPRFLGRGVAINVESSSLLALRQRLQTLWDEWLSPQDRQAYKPHITIQNKVAPEQARVLFGSMAQSWTAFSGTAEGLLLWRYLGGPWERVAEFGFDVL